MNSLRNRLRNIVASRVLMLAVQIASKRTSFGRNLLITADALFQAEARRATADLGRMRRERGDA